MSPLFSAQHFRSPQSALPLLPRVFVLPVAGAAELKAFRCRHATVAKPACGVLSVSSYAGAAPVPIHRAGPAPHTADLDEQPVPPSHQLENPMLHYAVVFLVIALIAAVFGFGGIAAGAVGIAKVLFVVFLIMAVVSFLFGILRKG